MSTVKDLMNNEELVRDITEDLEDFADDASVTYEVWTMGYNDNDMITDTEMFVASFVDPDEAVKCAKNLTLADIVQQASIEDNDKELLVNISYISVEVETVVTNDDEGSMNIGTIYKKEIYLEDVVEDYEEDDYVEDPIVELSTKDFELLEDGNLKISRKFLKDYNKNDYVRFHFADEAESSSFMYKIISKVMYADGDYFHCEMMI